MKIIDILGWCGTLYILGAYAYTAISGKAPGIGCGVLNTVGSAFIALTALHYTNYQSVALNVVWFIVSVVSTIKAFNNEN